MNRAAVVILNWNGMEDTKKCLVSVAGQKNAEFQIVLVDNGSLEKGTAEFLKTSEEKYGQSIVVLRNPKNLGFAGGVNTGIRYALENDFEYVALVNNDATLEPNWLAELIQTSVENKAGIATGLLLHADGKTIDSTGDWYSLWGLPFPRGRNMPASSAAKSGEVFGASGGCSLYSCSMLRDIGLFDETFFAYYEDADISFRARLRGWNVYYTHKAVAFHKQGATSSKIPGFTVYQAFKNLPLLFIKNVPLGLLFKVGVRFWFAYVLMFGNAI
ncbi:MAG TPA: glycosyltransferase family 2 protein, partial [Candidatus Saccharibacteria bacterium]|nr:glycosyltransferase family 2 protein [Candidatus Saccharibacteria bacterium]